MSKSESKKEDYEEVVIRRDMKNLTRIPFTRNGIVRTVMIQPGINRITDEEIIKCINDDKCNGVWKDFLKKTKRFPNGCHQIITGSVPKGSKQTTVFTAMSVEDCKTVINETYSIEQLEQMYADEEKKKGRKTVLKSILDQIDAQKADDAGKH